MNKFNVYQTISENFIEILKSHKKSNFSFNWFPPDGEIYALNPATNSFFMGFNQLYLSFITSSREYKQNRWVTLEQGNIMCGKLKDGEKPTFVFYFNTTYKDFRGVNVTSQVDAIVNAGGDIPDNLHRIPSPRFYYVYNLEQFDGIHEKFLFHGESIAFDLEQQYLLAEDFLTKTSAKIKYINEHFPCYYSGSDIIILPKKGSIPVSEELIKKMLLQLAQWSGHPKRLNRPQNYMRNSLEFAREELVTEFISAFISGYLGFASTICTNDTYVENWIKVVKSNEAMVYQASKDAQVAATYLKDLVIQGYAVIKDDIF